MNAQSQRFLYRVSVLMPVVAVTVCIALMSPSLRAQEAATTQWSAKSTSNAAVAVPAADKTTVVLFLRPGQTQTEEELPLLVGILKDRKDVEVVGIVSGDDATIGAAKLAAAGSKWPAAWPVVVDADYAASGKFNARVWPTTVVVDKTGKKVAHIAGLPVSFANDAAAYLDFAAGKIDKATLDKRLADRQVVADTADQKAGRHVEVAQRLALKGMRDDARREILSALAYKPKDDAVLLAIARTHLINRDAAEAQAVLKQLLDTGTSGGEINVLKGWTAMQGDNWADAKRILTDAVKLNPNPAEALYLLGRVYEHENDVKKAAECYRKAFEHAAAGKAMGL